MQLDENNLCDKTHEVKHNGIQVVKDRSNRNGGHKELFPVVPSQGNHFYVGGGCGAFLALLQARMCSPYSPWDPSARDLLVPLRDRLEALTKHLHQGWGFPQLYWRLPITSWSFLHQEKATRPNLPSRVSKKPSKLQVPQGNERGIKFWLGREVDLFLLHQILEGHQLWVVREGEPCI